MQLEFYFFLPKFKINGQNNEQFCADKKIDTISNKHSIRVLGSRIGARLLVPSLNLSLWERGWSLDERLMRAISSNLGKAKKKFRLCVSV